MEDKYTAEWFREISEITGTTTPYQKSLDKINKEYALVRLAVVIAAHDVSVAEAKSMGVWGNLKDKNK